jgi:protein-S-isoprenylcysteine O-methyltransferase Ste14
MKSGKTHLPLFGPGPVYVAVILALTVSGLLLAHYGLLDSGNTTVLRVPFTVLAALFILGGVVLWTQAVLVAKLDANILQNRLVTGGVYAWVRNPVYAAFLLVCTGALLFAHNLWLLLLPVFFWAFLTVLMKHTEEKWLHETYGAAYAAYCRRTNRCIPWPPSWRIRKGTAAIRRPRI